MFPLTPDTDFQWLIAVFLVTTWSVCLKFLLLWHCFKILQSFWWGSAKPGRFRISFYWCFCCCCCCWDVKADDSTPAFDSKLTFSAMFTLDQRTRLVTLKVKLLSNAGLDLLPYLFTRSFKWTTGSRKNKSIRFNYKGT